MGEQVRGRNLGMDLKAPKIDFCQLANAMGIPGQKVDRPEELDRTLKAALESDKPELIEVIIEGNI
ncbi:hypothetical protein ES703_42233 [subsurface metagenome]